MPDFSSGSLGALSHGAKACRSRYDNFSVSPSRKISTLYIVYLSDLSVMRRLPKSSGSSANVLLLQSSTEDTLYFQAT
jgi:hypothetical protein